ncbi:unnamed protein product, partial [Allacma fusca]
KAVAKPVVYGPATHGAYAPHHGHAPAHYGPIAHAPVAHARVGYAPEHGHAHAYAPVHHGYSQQVSHATGVTHYAQAAVPVAHHAEPHYHDDYGHGGPAHYDAGAYGYSSEY